MIVAGKSHFCAIDKEDQLVCWGPDCSDNINACWHARLRQSDEGELDTENSTSSVLHPLPGVVFDEDKDPLAKSNTFTSLTMQKKIRFVHAAEGTTCYVEKPSGTVHCFGYGDEDVLQGPEQTGFARVSVGGSTACAFSQYAETYCWGSLDPEPEDELKDLKCGTGYACTKNTQTQWSCEGSAFGEGVKPIEGLPFSGPQHGILKLDISQNCPGKSCQDFFCKITSTNPKNILCGGGGRPTKSKGMQEVPEEWYF